MSANARGRVFCIHGQTLSGFSGALFDDAVNQAVILGLGRGHVVVALGVVHDFFIGLAGALGQDAVHLFLGAQQIASLDFDVGGLAARAAQHLVNHDFAVGQAVALALGACGQKKRAHAGGKAQAHGGNIRLDELHGVVNGQARRDAAAGVGRRLEEVRARSVFEELVAVMRRELEDEVYRVAQVVARALEAQREVGRAVDRHTSLALLSTLQQVREHVASLVFDGFVAATPAEYLDHLPRYLRAAALRVDKAESAPSQDAALAYQVSEAEALVERARARAAALPADAQREALLVEGRWLVEELRVSLFAQTLGTSRKVSVQRIGKLLAKV